jgi:hypothetical protein
MMNYSPDCLRVVEEGYRRFRVNQGMDLEMGGDNVSPLVQPLVRAFIGWDLE